MIVDFKEYKFFIKPGITDMRKGINGLTVFIQDGMKKELFSKSMFLFCNKKKKLLRIIYWDNNGFCFWQKRLEKQKFPWPVTEEEANEISYDELSMLLRGIDFFNFHKKLSYSRV